MGNRSWAVGLSQVEFEREYSRRCGHIPDVIPAVEEYARGSEPVYHGIDPILPESYVVDDMPVPEKKAIPTCRGCGKEFNYPKGAAMARANHERHCKVLKEFGG